MVGPENTSFAYVFGYPGAPGRGGPVGRVARVPPEKIFGVRVLKLSDTAVRHPLAPSGASTEVPRRISLGFAHSAAAGGDLRKERLYAACSCWRTVCIPSEIRLVESSGGAGHRIHGFAMKFAVCSFQPTK